MNLNREQKSSDNGRSVDNESLRGKTLLLVNTCSTKKKFIIQRLKKLGLTLVVLNKDKNWAQTYVDHWIIADTYNHSESIQAVRNFIKENTQIKIDGVLTFWEDDVLLTSKIVDRFNFIGIPFSIAKKARNKYNFRDFCRLNSINAPRHILARTAVDIKLVCESFNFPIVIKPVYGASSAHVTKVLNKEELLQIFNQVKNNISTNLESALTDGTDILIEEYIDGDEVDIDLVLQNGKIKFYCISDNYDKNKGEFFVDRGQATPSSLPEKVQDEIFAMTEEILEKLGIQSGIIHFEAKATSKGPYPIEINLRLGGDYVYSYIKGAWRIDLIDCAVKIALGQYLKIKKIEEPKKYIIGWDLHAEHSGILVELSIDEKLNKKKYFEDLQINKEIGDAVLVPPEGYDYLGWITVSGDNILDAQDNLKEALSFIKYNVAKFHKASSIGKTLRKTNSSVAMFNKSMLLGVAKIEKIKRLVNKDQRKLHIGIACNVYDEIGGAVEKELMTVGKNVETTLQSRGYNTSFINFNNFDKVINQLKTGDIDLVFNLCERINDSSLLEPHAAALLDILQIPYTGSNPFTLGLCIDKIKVKKLLTYHNIPTPNWDYVYNLDDNIRDDLEFPLMIKPANTDNSIGINNDSVVVDEKGLREQMKKIIVELNSPVLIEEYIEGDEYDVSILGSDETNFRVLPLSRSIFQNMPKDKWHIYTHDSKFGGLSLKDFGIVEQRPAKGVSKKLISLISEIALDTYNILDCHDYGRVEVRVDEDDNPYVLELNPNPSINTGNCLPSVAELAGMDYGDFLEEIIRMTIERYKNRPPYYHLQSTII
ncbi:ATP-grasp domain-containing protein [Patescibacteria group bacterium]|nr:ATP-grasp domain-containing protein [Patescibacteria group bacterium]